MASAQMHARGCSRLQLERESGGDKDHDVASGADFPVRPSLPVAKLAAEFVIRHNAHAHFVGYEDRRTGEPTHGVGESRERRARIAAGQHEIAEPERQTIDNHHPARPRLRQEGRGNFEWLLERRPAVAPVGPVAGDPRRHFLISRRRGRQIEPLWTVGLGKPLRIGAFS